jgi:hypothetical protein
MDVPGAHRRALLSDCKQQPDLRGAGTRVPEGPERDARRAQDKAEAAQQSARMFQERFAAGEPMVVMRRLVEAVLPFDDTIRQVQVSADDMVWPVLRCSSLRP